MKINIDNLKIAHRGLWNKELPENSLGAFKKCIDNKVPIELDIHMLKDGALVVFHDDNLKRMTGLDAKIKNLNTSQIKKLKLLDTSYEIPLLSEVLDLTCGQVLIDIEIKSDVKNFEICKKLVKELENYNGNVLIKSFNPLYIVWFRFHAKEYTRGLLVSRLKNIKMNPLIKWMTYHMVFNFLASPDFIAFDKRDLPNKKIEKLYRKGLPVLLWTIKNSQEIEYNGIIYEE